MDYNTRRYVHYFQSGKGYYRGPPEQYGDGLGDFLGKLARGIIGFIRPAASAAATSFISNTAQGLTEGKSFKDSARTGLSSAVGSAIRGVGSEAERRIQGGSGKRKSKKRKHRRAKKAKAGRVHKKKRVYKKKRGGKKSNF